MAIILRGTKGSALSHVELDGNFTTLDSNDHSTYLLLANRIDTVQGNVAALSTTDYQANDYSTYITVTTNTYNTYKAALNYSNSADAIVTANIYDTWATLNTAVDVVQANLTATGLPTITLNRFDYIANANQTVFNGPDINSQTMYFDTNTAQVYMNGLLLRSSNDYTLTASSNTVTLQLAVSVGTELSVTSLSVS